jgi:hypothetical protein
MDINIFSSSVSGKTQHLARESYIILTMNFFADNMILHLKGLKNFTKK